MDERLGRAGRGRRRRGVGGGLRVALAVAVLAWAGAPVQGAEAAFEPPGAVGAWPAHWHSAAPSPAAADQTEPALRAALQQALWPADIARLATAYLQRYPDGLGAADARPWQQQAQRSADLLQRPEVQLFRAAFAVPAGGQPAAGLLRQAALGDAAAALQVSQQLPADGVGQRRALGWLQYAAALGSEQAAYTLALHYRRDAQPLLAARYESRALALGYQPPPGLDHLRK